MSNYPLGVSPSDFDEKTFYGTLEFNVEVTLSARDENEAEQKLENLAEEIKEQILNFGYKVDDVHITKQKLS